jgi:hypothetical protein
MMQYGTGMSAPVTTACTAASDSACDLSIDTMRACVRRTQDLSVQHAGER